MNLKKLFFNVLKIAVSCGLLYYIIRKVGWVNLVDSLNGLSAWWLLIPALLFSILNLTAGAYNYYRLVKLKDKDFKFWLLLKYYLYMWGISLFLPSRIGEFSMIYFLKSKNVDYGEATAMFVLEKLIVLTVVTFCALVGVFVLLPFWVAVEISATACGLGLLTLFLLLSDRAWGLLNKMLKGRLDKYSSYKGFLNLLIKQNPQILLYNFTAAVVRWVSKGYIFYFTFLAFGVSVPLLYAIIVNSIELFPGLLPITISGVGVRENVAVYLYTSLGVSAPVALAVYMVNYVMTFAQALLCLFLFKVEDVKK